MLKLLIYGYANGVMSSRKLERATHNDVAFRRALRVDSCLLGSNAGLSASAIAASWLTTISTCQR